MTAPTQAPMSANMPVTSLSKMFTIASRVGSLIQAASPSPTAEPRRVPPIIHAAPPTTNRDSLPRSSASLARLPSSLIVETHGLLIEMASLIGCTITQRIQRVCHSQKDLSLSPEPPYAI